MVIVINISSVTNILKKLSSPTNFGAESISKEQKLKKRDAIIGKTVNNMKKKRKGTESEKSDISLPPNDDFAFFFVNAF